MEISLIIPVYNSEQYLEECLNSIVNQIFEDWECLLVNDGSTDGSGNICNRYAEKDKRFNVFHIENSGVSEARNLGIKHASGKYFAFIDSDDTVDKEFLSALHEAMQKNKPQLVVCGTKLVYVSRTKINKATRGFVSVAKEDSDRFVELNRRFLLYGPFAKLYHSDIIKKNEIAFPSGIHYGEDLIFNFKYLEYVDSIFVIDSFGYNYRVLSEGSLSSSIRSRDVVNNYKQWDIIRTFFDKKNIEGKNARVYLSNRLWGIAYDLVMNNELSVEKIKKALSSDFTNDLRIYNQYTIDIPDWIEKMISKKMYLLIWLVQRYMKRKKN